MSMPLPLNEVKQWLRVDHDDEDTILQAIVAVAEEYLRSALPSWIDPMKNPPAKILALTLVADIYENRDVTADVRYSVQLAGYRPTIQSLLAQLKYAYPHIETPHLPDAFFGSEYSVVLKATGGTPPYKWLVIAGELAPGLTLDEATGEITG